MLGGIPRGSPKPQKQGYSQTAGKTDTKDINIDI